MVLKAYHQRGDMSYRQSCPHCGIGQVPVHQGYRCRYCGAEVVKIVREGQWPVAYLRSKPHRRKSNGTKNRNRSNRDHHTRGSC